MNYSFFDEMDELDDILNESDEIEDAIESTDELFEEKATQLEYAKRRFKEKYKFNPSNNTIEVEGERYKVKFPSNSGVVAVNNSTGIGPSKVVMPNRTSMDTVTDKNGAIMLDDTFFLLKDDKRRDALLKHEIGHSKLHSTVPGYKHTDTSKISKDMVIDEINNQCKIVRDTIKKSFGDDISDEMLNEQITTTRNAMMSNMKDYFGCSTATEAQSKIRADARRAANKYIPKQINNGVDKTHTNAQEFEADRYAVNHSSERSLKRGLREYYKVSSKPKNIRKSITNNAKADVMNQKALDDNKNADQVKVTKREINKSINNTYNSDPDIPNRSKGQIVKDTRKQQNKSASLDYTHRSKALKDNELRNNKALK